MKTVINTVSEINKYKIKLFSKSPIHGVLKVNEKNHGFLKYYYDKEEITDLNMGNYNKTLIQNIVIQAELILKLREGCGLIKD